jgi:hypothetical protein
LIQKPFNSSLPHGSYNCTFKATLPAGFTFRNDSRTFATTPPPPQSFLHITPLWVLFFASIGLIETFPSWSNGLLA